MQQQANKQATQPSKAVVAQQMKQQLISTETQQTKSRAVIGADLKPYPLTQDFRLRGTSSNQRWYDTIVNFISNYNFYLLS
jgi:hypothetical protein